MEAAKNWLNDKKNMPIVVGGLVGLLVLFAAVYFLFMRPDEPAVATTPTDMAGVPQAGMPGSPDAAMPPPIGAAPGTPGAPAAGGAPPAGAPPPDEIEPPIEVARVDPFRPVFGAKPKRPKPTLAWNYRAPDIRQVRPEAIDLAPDQPQQLPPQPPRRMAGILQNDRIYGIIVEDRGGRQVTQIVAPGDPLGENLVVDRILPDRVILRAPDSGQVLEIPKSAGAPRPRTTTGTGREPGRPPGPMGPPAPRGGPMEAPPPPMP